MASGVGLAAARANGDEEIFGRLVQLSEVVGAPITTGAGKLFLLGNMVVGDAFLAWGKTVTPWTRPAPYAVSDYPRLASPWYGWTNSLIALVAVALAVFAVRARRQAESR